MDDPLLIDAPFPSITPSGRSWNTGQFPIKTYTSQNGAEIRILYSDAPTNKTLNLEYEGIEDEKAELFFDHFYKVKGIYHTFLIYKTTYSAKTGWAGKESTLGAWGDTENPDLNRRLRWRYAEPPVITSVYPGRSNISVKLVAVR